MDYNITNMLNRTVTILRKQTKRNVVQGTLELISLLRYYELAKCWVRGDAQTEDKGYDNVLAGQAYSTPCSIDK
jgi:hypothetical protein